MPIQITDLLITQACRLTCGRIDVNSKRTFHQLGRPDLRQDLQFVWNKMRLIKRHAELRVGNENVRVRGNRLQRCNVPAQPFAREPFDNCDLQIFEHLKFSCISKDSSVLDSVAVFK